MQNAQYIGGTQVAVGLSATIGITAAAFQIGCVVKKLSGGTLAIVKGASSIGSAGYILGDSEAFSINGPATVFLAATGTTVVVALSFAYSASAGVTLP